MRQGGRIATASALLLVVTAGVTACASDAYDDVLWRQLDAQQSGGLWSRLSDLRTSIEPFSAEILTQPEPDADWSHWDGAAEPDIDPDAGTVVAYDVREDGAGATVTFDALFFSGPREDDGTPYAGPNSVYTCESYRLTIRDGLLETIRAIRGDDGESGPACPSALVDALGPGAAYAPPGEFDG